MDMAEWIWRNVFCRIVLAEWIRPRRIWRNEFDLDRGLRDEISFERTRSYGIPGPLYAHEPRVHAPSLDGVRDVLEGSSSTKKPSDVEENVHEKLKKKKKKTKKPRLGAHWNGSPVRAPSLDGVRDVLEGSPSTKKPSDVQEQLSVTSVIELRQGIWNFSESPGFKKAEEVKLMEELHRTFPEEFPRPQKLSTFKATIKKTIEGNEEAEVKERKLNCLQEAAKSFKPELFPWWDEKKGEQFYILCKEVVLWNKSLFHPDVKGELKSNCMKKASDGLYMVDGVDVGPLMKEVFQA